MISLFFDSRNAYIFGEKRHRRIASFPRRDLEYRMNSILANKRIEDVSIKNNIKHDNLGECCLMAYEIVRSDNSFQHLDQDRIVSRTTKRIRNQSIL